MSTASLITISEKTESAIAGLESNFGGSEVKAKGGFKASKLLDASTMLSNSSVKLPSQFNQIQVLPEHDQGEPRTSKNVEGAKPEAMAFDVDRMEEGSPLRLGTFDSGLNDVQDPAKPSALPSVHDLEPSQASEAGDEIDLQNLPAMDLQMHAQSEVAGVSDSLPSLLAKTSSLKKTDSNAKSSKKKHLQVGFQDSEGVPMPNVAEATQIKSTPKKLQHAKTQDLSRVGSAGKPSLSALKA